MIDKYINQTEHDSLYGLPDDVTEHHVNEAIVLLKSRLDYIDGQRDAITATILETMAAVDEVAMRLSQIKASDDFKGITTKFLRDDLKLKLYQLDSKADGLKYQLETMDNAYDTYVGYLYELEDIAKKDDQHD